MLFFFFFLNRTSLLSLLINTYRPWTDLIGTIQQLYIRLCQVPFLEGSNFTIAWLSGSDAGVIGSITELPFMFRISVYLFVSLMLTLPLFLCERSVYCVMCLLNIHFWMKGVQSIGIWGRSCYAETIQWDPSGWISLCWGSTSRYLFHRNTKSKYTCIQNVPSVRYKQTERETNVLHNHWSMTIIQTFRLWWVMETLTSFIA
jgi:hypothetical protein